MIFASCHCGAVRIEIARRPRQVTACNCSICRRYGALWAYYTRKTVRLAAATGACGAYRWGRKSIAFHFCRTCGCVTHYERSRPSGEATFAVNARNLPPDVVAALRVRHFDGADSGTYMD